MSKHKGLYVVLGFVGTLVVLFGAVSTAYAQGPQPPVDDRPLYGNGYCGYGYAGQAIGGWGWG